MNDLKNQMKLLFDHYVCQELEEEIKFKEDQTNSKLKLGFFIHHNDKMTLNDEDLLIVHTKLNQISNECNNNKNLFYITSQKIRHTVEDGHKLKIETVVTRYQSEYETVFKTFISNFKNENFNKIQRSFTREISRLRNSISQINCDDNMNIIPSYDDTCHTSDIRKKKLFNPNEKNKNGKKYHSFDEERMDKEFEDVYSQSKTKRSQTTPLEPIIQKKLSFGSNMEIMLKSIAQIEAFEPNKLIYTRRSSILNPTYFFNVDMDTRKPTNIKVHLSMKNSSKTNKFNDVFDDDILMDDEDDVIVDGDNNMDDNISIKKGSSLLRNSKWKIVSAHVMSKVHENKARISQEIRDFQRNLTLSSDENNSSTQSDEHFADIFNRLKINSKSSQMDKWKLLVKLVMSIVENSKKQMKLSDNLSSKDSSSKSQDEILSEGDPNEMISTRSENELNNFFGNLKSDCELCNCEIRRYEVMAKFILNLITKKVNNEDFNFDDDTLHFKDCPDYLYLSSSPSTKNGIRGLLSEYSENILNKILKNMKYNKEIDCTFQNIKYFVNSNVYEEYKVGFDKVLRSRHILENLILFLYLTRLAIKEIDDPNCQNNKTIKKIITFAETFLFERYYNEVSQFNTLENFITAYDTKAYEVLD